MYIHPFLLFLIFFIITLVYFMNHLRSHSLYYFINISFMFFKLHCNRQQAYSSPFYLHHKREIVSPLNRNVSIITRLNEYNQNIS